MHNLSKYKFVCQKLNTDKFWIQIIDAVKNKKLTKIDSGSIKSAMHSLLNSNSAAILDPISYIKLLDNMREVLEKLSK